jgi:4-alpha-glucanotransferase
MRRYPEGFGAMKALDVLSERIGIEAQFDDALGKKHQTPPEKKQALLAAMGVAAVDDEQAAATLIQLDEREWSRALPPCVVLYSTGDLLLPLTLPAGPRKVRWTLTLEDAEERCGETEFEQLAQVGTYQLGGQSLERRSLALPKDLPWGYHRLTVEGIDGPGTSVIVTPGRCWLPGEDTDTGSAGRTVQTEQRFWGVAAQVYLLRSERNWGIGDFTDLRNLVQIVREKGGDCVGVNPLHGMFMDSPEQSSPYSPLSRYLLNALNIDVEAVPEYRTCAAARQFVDSAEFREKLQQARAAKMVAYEDVAALKFPLLQMLFTEFERAADENRREQFRAFLHGCDELLQTSCTFAAIRQYLTDQDLLNRDCGRWPEGFKHAESEGVEQFRRTHAELVRYHLWLQFVADQQLRSVQEACEGMAVGIYRDLAVGANPSGAEIWSNPGVMVGMAEVGAPPDILNTQGQNWVLPPFHPQAMWEDGYRSFIALVRTNMRHAGGLRIDHAMALQRLYWIPRGGSPKDGGYVRYPTEDLIGVLALESHRNRCLVVGEDLGTVAPGFRERMAEARILSYKVLLLEEKQGGEGYVDLADYPRLALSTASSHDLPTLRGWWEEVDLDLRERLGLIQPEDSGKQRHKREQDREAMLAMFREEGLLEGKSWPITEEFIDAAHRFLLRSKAILMMAQLEDIVEEAEQVNLPASMPDQYPSWSRRVSTTLEDLANDNRLLRLSAIAKEERG